MRLFFLALFLVATLIDAQMTSRTKVLMGTFATISLEPQNKKCFASAFSSLEAVENALSSYKKSSPIYKLNHEKNVTISPLTYEALTLSQLYYQKSETYFNVAIGSITKSLYKFGADESVPSSEALQKSNTSLKSLHFDATRASIDEGVKIDLGGMGKGFGVDKAILNLKACGVEKAVVALSGDIRCLGRCSVNIQDPFSDGTLARFVTKIDELGISTSGNYNRYVKDKTHNHLINPKTKHSQQLFASITLISKLPSSDLDAYATAASVMPLKRAYSFLDSLELAYVTVEVSGKITVSENIEQFVNLELLHDGEKE